MNKLRIRHVPRSVNHTAIPVAREIRAIELCLVLHYWKLLDSVYDTPYRSRRLQTASGHADDSPKGIRGKSIRPIKSLKVLQQDAHELHISFVGCAL
jgi:hypothetical protein